MRILVTGNRGHVGAPVAAHLEQLGHDVVGCDRLDGDDLLDSAAVRRAAGGCAAVVHAGALAHDSAGSPEDIMAVNVLGTWHVLLAAEAAGARRVVYFSSGQVFGVAEGEPASSAGSRAIGGPRAVIGIRPLTTELKARSVRLASWNMRSRRGYLGIMHG